MTQTIQQALSALTTFPGNLVYHLGLAFALAGALQAALTLWRDQEYPQGKRMVVGLSLLLTLRVVFFLLAGMIQQGMANPHVLLPVADRALNTLSIIILLWLWIFPEPSRLADAASGLLALLPLPVLALSAIWWFGHYSEVSFNATWVNTAWEIFALLLLLPGALYLTIRKPNSWNYGLVMLLLLAFGHLLHLAAPNADSDFAGFVRLAQLAAYPLLLTLPRRFALAPAPAPPVAQQVPQPTPAAQPREPHHSLERLKAALALTQAETPQQRCQAITHLVAETMLSDICLLIDYSSEERLFLIRCGYDLIRQEYIPTNALHAEQLPLLTTALHKNRSLRLPASSTSQDLATLEALYQLGNTGHLLASFLPNPSGAASMGIILLSPYSNHRWNSEDQVRLEEITQQLAPILHQTVQETAQQRELEAAKSELQTTRADLDEALSRLAALDARFEELQAENAQLQAALAQRPESSTAPDSSSALETLQEEYQKAQGTLARLQVENRRLGEMVESLIAEADTHGLTTSGQLKMELQQAQEEIAHLKKQLLLAEQQAAAKTYETASQETTNSERTEMLASIAQDLRQPLSSILGYTDLLLGESVGILGALQRKFLERIRASIERMQLLLDDLIHVSVLEGQEHRLKPKAVDLSNAIDKAIADTRAQMRDKNIILRVDLPDELPLIHADRDALQQILVHLLKNASSVSPVEGEILLRAEIQKSDDQQDFILIQVADQGGGIPEEELPRVFSRLYRADNPLIQGVGDAGVGLSIVKTLVEAHHGRIWVDTEMGKGSAFNVLLPLSDGMSDTTAEEALER